MSFVARIGILDVIMHDEKRFFLETTPGKLFLKASIPGAIGMMASNIYFSVEMLLVGRLCGSEAFAAGNLALPLVYINFALADMVSVGSSVKIAIRLGEGKKDEANRLFTTAILTAIVLSTLSSILLVILSPMLFHLMGAGEHLLDDAMAYLVVYAIFCPITSLAFVFDNFLKISGKVRFSMFANIAMSVMSLLFDIIFLYVLDKGIGFAALGTSLGMALTVLFSALPFFSGKLTLRFTKVRLSLKPLKDIFAQGVPNFLNNISTKLTSVIMNSLLLRLGGEMAVSVYGVFMNLDGVIVPGMYGVFDSLQPAIGYNWGAGRKERVRRIAFYSTLAIALMCIAFSIVLKLFPTEIFSLFLDGSGEIIKMAEIGISILALTYVTRWIGYACQSFSSAIGENRIATLISFLSALFFPVLSIFLLRPFELDGLWFVLPLAALLTALVSLIVYLGRLGKLIR